MILCLLFLSCSVLRQSPTAQRDRVAQLPSIVLWAWERPEDLRFLDPEKFGVAFLAQTLVLSNEEVILKQRRQPLEVDPRTKLIAVTRIESQKTTSHKAALTGAQQEKLVSLIVKTLDLDNVTAIQIDFDVALSERPFYRKLLEALRQRMPDNVPLSITALASFCLGDRWMTGLAVDEVVPMIFRMGADDRGIKQNLAEGVDFREPLCRASYGISLDEPLEMQFDYTRRIYLFSPRSWKESDLRSFTEKIEK